MKVLHYLLALFVFLHSGSAVTEYYVRSTTSTDCPAEPCITLNEYAHNSEKYFTSNTAFIFLDGEHYLDTLLILTSLSYLSMNGTANVTIILSEYAFITAAGMQEFAISSLEIKYHSYHINDEDGQALVLYASQNVTLTGVTFSKLPGPDNYFTRAVSIYLTNVNFTNCSSYNGIGSLGGGAVAILKGTVYFSGENTFAFNQADKGAAIYMEDSVVVFNGTNTFLNNRGTPGRLNLEPEAIHAVNSTVAFQGEVNFIGNSALFGGSSDVSGAFLLSKNNIWSRPGINMYNLVHTVDIVGVVWSVKNRIYTTML